MVKPSTTGYFCINSKILWMMRLWVLASILSSICAISDRVSLAFLSFSLYLFYSLIRPSKSLLYNYKHKWLCSLHESSLSSLHMKDRERQDNHVHGRLKSPEKLGFIPSFLFFRHSSIIPSHHNYLWLGRKIGKDGIGIGGPWENMAPNCSNWPLHVCEVGVLILLQACANTLDLCPVAMGNPSGKRWVLYK